MALFCLKGNVGEIEGCNRLRFSFSLVFILSFVFFPFLAFYFLSSFWGALKSPPTNKQVLYFAWFWVVVLYQADNTIGCRQIKHTYFSKMGYILCKYTVATLPKRKKRKFSTAKKHVNHVWSIKMHALAIATSWLLFFFETKCRHDAQNARTLNLYEYTQPYLYEHLWKNKPADRQD